MRGPTRTGMPRRRRLKRAGGRSEHPGNHAFITLTGIAAFLIGALLAGIALLVAVVQGVAGWRNAALIRFLPPALGATAAAFLAGTWLVLASEFRWVQGELLDNLSPFVFVAAVWWMFRNRMGSARNRREGSADAQPR